MARTQATLTYTENGQKRVETYASDYFYNSKLVNQFNQSGVYDGARADVEVIVKGLNFEKGITPANDMYLMLNSINHKVLQVIPVSGTGGRVTTFMAVRSQGGPK
jgi:hypothetical protein